MTNSRKRPPPEQLAPGLHERLWTRSLEAAAHDLRESCEIESIEGPDLVPALSGHLTEKLRELLEQVPGSAGSAEHREILLKLHGRLLEQLTQASREFDAGMEEDLDDQIVGDGEQLLSVWPSPPMQGPPPSRPYHPLAENALLVNARGEVRIGKELALEIGSADRVLVIIPFLRFSGYRLLAEELEALCARGGQLRVLTSVYLGSTETRVLDELCRIGAEVRVSQEIQSTRLHAKAWVFERESSYHTAYVGSSNLSRTALIDGLEWNVRLSQQESSAVMDQVREAFEAYWQDSSTVPYTGSNDDRAHIEKALQHAGSRGVDTSLELSGLEVRPYQFQREILDSLQFAREEQGHHRNLIVAATGTGKTVIAALDYRHLCQGTSGRPSLLFVAHRREILEQSLRTYREALGDGGFGRTWMGEARPEGSHLFVSVQTLQRQSLDSIAEEAFAVVVVDEFHHAEAGSYRRWLEHLKPQELLGLTATPERADGIRVQDEYFGGRICAELRVWDAIDRGLLCPFHYFGIPDNTDLRQVEWKRGRYDSRHLEGIYTGNDARVTLIIKQLERRIADPHRARMLGFCVSVGHAKYMAAKFTQAGLTSQAVTGETPKLERQQALADLRSGKLRVIFSVDVFNEGVDLPTVDTLLLLRPTESATLFLQQLGRGLRNSEGKDCLTVLDFIGQAHRQFRFDLSFRALLGMGRRDLTQALEHDFPVLPSGCALHLEPVARQYILDNLKQSIGHNWTSLVRELKVLGADTDLPAFLDESGLALPEVYRDSGRTWRSLREAAGFEDSDAEADELLRFACRMALVDDVELLRSWHCFLNGTDQPPNPHHSSLLAATLMRKWSTDEESGFLDRVRSHSEVRDELSTLVNLAKARISHQSMRFADRPKVPLRIHSHYTLAQIQAAFTIKMPLAQKGVHYDGASDCDLFFVTVQKTEKHYSPRTMYKDHALTESLFQWQTQNRTGSDSPTMARYRAAETESDGYRALLFVRDQKKTEQGVTSPYCFLGPVEFVRDEGSRPVTVTWQMRWAIPGELYRRVKFVG
jgi:superfamily II DNA or RNA helicase/HKD family nuclease